MQIKVLFFGQLRDVCGRSEDQLELPAGSRVGGVFQHYAAKFPMLQAMARSIVLARNHEFTGPETELAENDEIALLPPVSGGAPLANITDPEGHYFALTRDSIDPRQLESRLLQGIDGALVTFLGVVRNNTKGRKTLRLDYDCYEPMALREMATIGREVAAQFGISRIAIVHRLGMMDVSEASVAVVVTSPHRRAAFDAALEGINRLKKTVPVWKKEFFEDGEIWVEGDWDDKTPRAVPD